MSKADKKQRHRAKREKKKLAARRFQAISPLKRLADAPGELECWQSGRLDVERQVQIFCYKRAGGLTGLACFLLDRGVVGLKDAWSRINFERAEFENLLKRCERDSVAARRVTVDDFRRILAGAVRWTHENKMRLPKDWQKVAQIVGGVGDWASADVSEFVMEFVGHPEDLRQRLLGEPFESYINRRDVALTFSNDAPYMDQETGSYDDSYSNADDEDDDEPPLVMPDLGERFIPVLAGLVENTRRWLIDRQQSPSPELAMAWRIIMVAQMVATNKIPNLDDSANGHLAAQITEDLLNTVDDELFEETDRAVNQALEHLQTNSMMMREMVLERMPN